MRGINGKKEWIFLEMNYYRNCEPKFENRLKEMRLIILRKRKKKALKDLKLSVLLFFRLEFVKTGVSRV